MPSPTRRTMSADDVRAAAFALLDVRATRATPMDGGSVGAVRRVRLEDARDVVLKVAPAPWTRLVTYEADMVGAEAEYLRLAGPKAYRRMVEAVLDDSVTWGVRLPVPA